MGYIISGTTASHRNSVKKEYLIVINPKVKKKLKLGKFCCVSHLLNNNVSGYEDEYINLRVMPKVITDKNVNINKILLDQSLRNAIGVEDSIGNNINSKISVTKLKTSLSFKVKNILIHDRKLFCRIRRAMAVDMEKDYSTVNENIIKILGTVEGKKINIYSCTSKIRQELFADDSRSNLEKITYKFWNCRRCQPCKFIKKADVI